ncbi:unnamed protein product [Owenia fusiformis]|uniref:Uncharacterized protein n=1 Tax=Owenia fusiformis TaxID=6347 RepID=A0A8S4MZN0_OWEFU|nr:unnamed protein product [Owenia fusiformis]
MGLGQPTNIGNHPNSTRQADPALLTRLRTSIHWEARHDGVLKGLNNYPGGIPRGLIPNIRCGAPEKETSDIAKAFDVILHHCSGQLTEATTLHSQNRLDYHRQQTIETIQTLAKTIGHVEADKLAEQYRREASKPKRREPSTKPRGKRQ